MSELSSNTQQLISIKTSADDTAGKLGAPNTRLLCADKVNAASKLEIFFESADVSAGLKNDHELISFLGAVFDLSPYIFDLAIQFPEVLLECAQAGYHKAIKTSLDRLKQPFNTEQELMKALRYAKRQAALICGLADLGGWWSAAEVSRQISCTADVTLQAAVDFILLDAHNKGKLSLSDVETPSFGSGYTVLAMGKHGAGELNYSSDIDIIVLFDPLAEAVLDPDESVALFVRLTKSLVRIMQERTEHGYVFRTDLRLRPDPGSMPLAIPINVAMNYYESRGQNWERAAMIKARVAAGDNVVGEAMLHELTPFIWRRYLDYAAIADVHSIKRQIQSHRGYTALSVPGHNVKLGRGGIREIEFFVQTQQLIAGGRIPALRGKRTVDTLSDLVEHGWIEEKVRDDLCCSYGFLRDVEHRIQMVADAQTHTLPEDETNLLVIARLCGFEEISCFSDALINHLHRVEEHYGALFEEAPELGEECGNLSFTGDDDDPNTVETLARMGFERPSSIISIVRAWHFGRYPAMQSSDARERLTELTPALLTALADAGKGDEALLAFDEFLKGLPRGFQLFSLLNANPQLLSLLVRILGAAPRLAQVITRRPHVFDGLLEPGFFNNSPSQDQICEGLARSLKQARDYEDGLNRARIFVDEQRFLIGIRVLSETLDPKDAGIAFTDLAEVMLRAMVDWVRVPFEEAHGRVPSASFSLLAMGNFGTRELTASSDLDLVMLYEYAPEDEYSDGPKSLHASQYFGRFTQRLIAAMGAPTSDGIIYEMDFRLRPSGNAGPIATSLRAFTQYYEESAWTWENLALTRARPVAGDGKFGGRVNQVISDLLAQPRDHNPLAKDILEMRLLMDKERPAGDTWDVKLSKGGLIDVEFIAQWLVLTGKASRGGSTAELLESLDQTDENAVLLNAHHTYSRVLQLLRLCLGQSSPLVDAPKELAKIVLRLLDFPDMNSAEAFMKETQQSVRKIFLKRLK
ncbi:MAG: bifunctional [glutamine synthetase] adenylyltransferase/[glutamine synthetase]-adenylyl-L-tyrosine phosphorylase [Rhizobiaceae bacterium]